MLVGRRSGWLLASCGIVLLGSTPALPQTPVLSQDACASCDKQLTLTRAEWDCLAQSIDRYMTVKSDPVLVPFVQCQQRQSPPVEPGLRADPLILPRQTPTGVASYRRALRLSKQQLRCLKEKLPAIMQAPPAVFEFDPKCLQGGQTPSSG